MSTMSQFFGGGASIKGIQRGFFTSGGTSQGTITISSVTTSKTEVRFLGAAATSSGMTIRLLNSTELYYQGVSSVNWLISWELTEWN
jgi:hypothetical protein